MKSRKVVDFPNYKPTINDGSVIYIVDACVEFNIFSKKEFLYGFTYNSGNNEEWEDVESLRSLIKEHVDSTFEA